MRIKLFEQFVNENGIGGVNVGGVNFGSDKGDVGVGNFGAKGDSTFNQRGDMNPVDSSMVRSEYDGEYYSQTDIRALQFKYDVWCKQNNEEPLEMTEFTTQNLDYMLKTIDSE